MEGGTSLKVKTEAVRKHLLCKCGLFLLFFHQSLLTENTKCRFVQLFGLCVCVYLDRPARLPLFGRDGWQRGHGAGRGQGDVWCRFRCHQVQFGQLCLAASDVPPGEGLRCVLAVQKQALVRGCFESSLPWQVFFASLEIVLTLIKGVCLVCLPLSCLPSRAGRQIWSRDVCRPLVSRQSTVLESRWKDSAFLSASLQANSARMTNFSQCKLSLKVVFLLLPYLPVAPDFPKVRVPQRRLRSDALVGVVGEHLVEQRQRRGRAARDQPGDAAALFRREVEMHGSRPAGERDETLARLFALHGQTQHTI